MDKNQAMIDYLLTCDAFKNGRLYFNFVNAKDKVTQFLTLEEDKANETPYIDGSIAKQYSLTVMLYLAVSSNPIVKAPNYDNENIVDMAEVQDLMDWINEQNDIKHFPDFGSGNHVEEISTTASSPRLAGIDATITPPLGKYSFTIQVKYIDKSKRIWN